MQRASVGGIRNNSPDMYGVRCAQSLMSTGQRVYRTRTDRAGILAAVSSMSVNVLEVLGVFFSNLAD